MTAVAAVGIHDNLAPGQAGISHRPADYESARRVDVVLRVLVQHRRWNDWLNDMLENCVTQIVVRDAIAVLRRNHDRIHARRLAIAVFNVDL